ncbi:MULTISPECIES: hypothetical protein [unclassified Pseudofrankia]|uniref:hypothetical protein n=1 Tax=unclassified Pseudofrankia TaxID=2994372 RepID=UPI0008DB125D|nr:MULTISPECIES: hypothetical protein [unclassified Pseudofrankia]MDT3438775.1 hypothetical protein [Pseudofrankia sp. BMG5.37]OHV72852.1 hypothetical protein BCD48_34000 [Pseudofrankia sp. BMG5.36]
MHRTSTPSAPRAAGSPQRRTALPPSTGAEAGGLGIQALSPAAESTIKSFSGFCALSAGIGEAATSGVTRQVRRSSGRLGGGGGPATSRTYRIPVADPAGTPSPVRKGTRAR